MTEIINYPINKDRRTWFDKLRGVPFSYRYLVDGPSKLCEVNEMNRRNSGVWHCKIGTVRFGHKTYSYVT